jgi:hypothetical protein
MVAEPGSPLEGNVGSSSSYSIDSRRYKREVSAGDVGGGYIVNGTGPFNSRILFVTPVDAFNPRELSIQTRIICWISITNSDTI